MALTAEQKQQALNKAMQDEAFRAALQRDAKAAIRAELQVPLPPEVTLHVLAPTATEVYYVLPAYPADWPRGLSVAELEQRLVQELAGLQKEQQRERLATLTARAWHDPSYHQALLRDPATVLQRDFGVTLPAEMTVKVVAEDAQTQYLVLPPELDEMELSDEQLEQVAGGEAAMYWITQALADW